MPERFQGELVDGRGFAVRWVSSEVVRRPGGAALLVRTDGGHGKIAMLFFSCFRLRA